jgi:hypothetical protein
MMRALIARDERESGIDQAADRVAYLVLSYGLLLLVAYRSFVEGVASFELLALVIAGGLAGLAYRAYHRAVTGRSIAVIGLTVVVAVVVAVIVALLRG